MSETINRLKNIEIGCVYIGELDKRGDELKVEIQRLSNWITQLIGCDWCMIKECFYTQEENIYSLLHFENSVLALVYAADRNDVNINEIL